MIDFDFSKASDIMANTYFRFYKREYDIALEYGDPVLINKLLGKLEGYILGMCYAGCISHDQAQAYLDDLHEKI